MNATEYKSKIIRLLNRLKNNHSETERLRIILEIEEMIEALLPD